MSPYVAMPITSSLTLPLVVPIPDAGNSGYFKLSELSHPSKAIYLISFNLAPDNRMTSRFLQTFLKVLEIVEANVSEDSVLLTTSEIPKFYSNGYDVEGKDAHNATMSVDFLKVALKLLQFPIPTIALLNGHTVGRCLTVVLHGLTHIIFAHQFAAGVFLVMAHDYRIMNGWYCSHNGVFVTAHIT